MGSLEIENRCRDVVTIPLVASYDKHGRPKYAGQIVIGDFEDRVAANPEDRNTALQPDPHVVITDEQWLMLTDDGRALVKHYVDRGDFFVLRGRDLLDA